ncbi:MAG: NUDIX domain-containing protein, partial [Aquabacterium sp.]
LAQDRLPRHGIETYTQGLMDLGATLCTQRAPRCGDCPVAADCVARLQGDPTRLPVKTRRLSRRTQTLALLWLQQRDGLWLHPRPAKGIWGGLWCLPVWDDLPTLQRAVATWPGRGLVLEPVTHDLTHRRLELLPLRWHLPARLTTAQSADIQGLLPSQARWFSQADALALGLPAPVRRWIDSPPPV